MSQTSEIPHSDDQNGPFGPRGYGNNGFRSRCMHGGDGARRCVGGNPIEIAAIVLGFIVFWPIGLALLFWRLMRNKGQMPFAQNWGAQHWGFNDGANWRGFGGNFSSGNSAFDDWKTAELNRLEEERRKLAEAQKAFSDHLNNLRKAKDRTQFDEFMAQYRAKSE